MSTRITHVGTVIVPVSDPFRVVERQDAPR